MSTSAAEVVVQVGGWVVSPQHISIAPGDTVTWVNTNETTSKVIRSLSGDDWQPVPLGPGESAARIINEAGFVAYETEDLSRVIQGRRWQFLGTLSVHSSSTGLPVYLAAPVEGLVLRSSFNGPPILFAAGVALPEPDIERIEFFWGTNLLGTAHAPPYEVSVPQLAAGEHQAWARLVDQQGTIFESPKVPFTVKELSDPRHFSFLHVLPRGEVVLSVIPPFSHRNEIHYSSDLVEWHGLQVFTHTLTTIDFSATNSARRFYRIRQSDPP